MWQRLAGVVLQHDSQADERSLRLECSLSVGKGFSCSGVITSIWHFTLLILLASLWGRFATCSTDGYAISVSIVLRHSACTYVTSGYC